MKKVFLLKFLSLFILLVHFHHPLVAKEDESKHHSHSSKKEKDHKHCKKVTRITKLPFTIKKSGYYKLSCDLEFKPKPSKFAPPDPRAVQAAITVNPGVSDVIIDLGNHRLSQAGAGTSTQIPYVVGILVPDPDPTNPNPNFVGAQSIYIQGDQGIIDGFSMFGIRIFAHTYDIRISDITVKNVGALASAELRPASIPSYVPHSISENTAFGTNNAFQTSGIAIGETRFNGMGPNFFTESTVPVNRVGSVVLENVSCLNNFYGGLLNTFTTDVSINNCHFDDTWSDQPNFTVGTTTLGARTPLGGYFVGGGNDNSPNGVGVINLRVENSTFNNTQLRGNGVNTFDFINANSSGANGVAVYDSQNCIWNNCQFNNTSSTFASTGFFIFTAGFISGGMVDTTFIDCSFDGTKSVSGANGFHISGSGNTFAQETTRGSRNTLLINCTARNIQQIGNLLQPAPVATTNSQAVGFLISFATNITLENCIASDIIVNGPLDAAGFAVGYRIAGNATRIDENKVFQGCQAYRCLALNGGQVRGFSVVATNSDPPQVERSIVFEDCIAEGCIASPGIAPGVSSIGCGFYIEGDSVNPPNATSDFPKSFINCQALRNKGAPSAVVAGLTQYSAGFYCLGLQRSAFVECKALDNVYGFFLQRSDRNTISNCRADNNVDTTGLIGEGFTDIGATGTPVAPSQSFSLFQGNSAFNNGPGTPGVFVGPNSNYNLWVDPAPSTLRPPLLNWTYSTGVQTPIPAPYNAGVHNISAILQ
jgi:parallel beta-helix repeat protein